MVGKPLKKGFVGLGPDNPFYGRHHTDETKRKISFSKKGKICISLPVANKECLVCKTKFILRGYEIQNGKKYCSRRCANSDKIGKMLGKNNPAWKGGLSRRGRYLRTTPEYYFWRNQVLRRDNFTCQICGKIGGEIQADHKLPFAYYPEKRFLEENGRTLCKNCHLKTETWGYRSSLIKSASQYA